ncbi:extracellular solute-binding protein [Paradevosia shaoguanensis]|uniref:extracellular solute-binding protein n=1 Tax=Paradevosia shaoguanensis TaxID=1335043 RepID=UPI001932A41D|nr:extracellular solute-binding protein [Paradevosia shaoguanensis]
MSMNKLAILPVLGLLLSAAPVLAENLVVASYGGKTPEHWRTYVFDAFTADTGITVEQVIVPGKIVAGMQAQQQTGKVQWDISTSLAASDFATLAAAGYLAKVPDDVKQELSANYGLISDYGVASKTGALMIICNKKAVEKCPTTAAEMMDVENFPGTRFMPNFQPLEALTFAAYASGVAPDAIYPLDVDRAIAELNKIRPSIAQFYDNSTTARQLLSSGEVVMGLLWNGIPPQILGEGNVNVDLQVSWDGAVTYSQWTAVYNNGPNTETAWKFLKWLNTHPEAVAAYASAEGTDTANKAAFALQTEEIKEWSPVKDHGVPTLPVNTEWYMAAGDTKTKIDEFWKNYIN